MVHADKHDVKYRQPGTVYDAMLFDQLKQSIVSHAIFKVTRFVDFRPYLKSPLAP